jgi:glycosyltransferase involved in cell wall biosynthesis
MTVQGLFGWYKQRVPLMPYDRLMATLESSSLRRAPVVTTESNFAVDFLRTHYPGIQVYQAEHAPNRVFTNVTRKPQIAPPHFIAIGTLGFRKGTDLLLKGLNALATGEGGKALDFKLTMISNPNPSYLEDMRHQLSPDFWKRIEFKHHILPHEVARELETPTMLLLPTRADTSPNAVKEAVVAGVPVLASDVGGIPDYVFPEKNGLLFPASDLEAFKRTIRTACSHPLFSEGKVEAQSWSKARDYLSPERMAINFKAAYRAAMNRAGKPLPPGF